MVVTDIITPVRRALNDVGPFYEWQDTELLQIINEAQDEVHRVAPWAAVLEDDTDLDLTAPTDLTATSDTVEINASLLMALVHYTVSRCMERRSPSVDRNEAVYHRNEFNRIMAGRA